MPTVRTGAYNELPATYGSEGMEEQLQSDGRTTEPMTDAAVVASGASVGLALYYYFVRGDHDRGLFVGLWAPTILGFANYLEEARTRALVERTLGEGTLRQTVRRAVKGDS